MLMAPLVPAETIAAFALIRPSSEFKVETKGCGVPLGHMVRYPSDPCGTTVTFSEKACAVAGIPQALVEMVNSRVAPPPSAGPPNGPVGLRVSAMRHGGTGT